MMETPRHNTYKYIDTIYSPKKNLVKKATFFKDEIDIFLSDPNNPNNYSYKPMLEVSQSTNKLIENSITIKRSPIVELHVPNSILINKSKEKLKNVKIHATTMKTKLFKMEMEDKLFRIHNTNDAFDITGAKKLYSQNKKMLQKGDKKEFWRNQVLANNNPQGSISEDNESRAIESKFRQISKKLKWKYPNPILCKTERTSSKKMSILSHKQTITQSTAHDEINKKLSQLRNVEKLETFSTTKESILKKLNFPNLRDDKKKFSLVIKQNFKFPDLKEKETERTVNTGNTSFNNDENKLFKNNIKLNSKKPSKIFSYDSSLAAASNLNNNESFHLTKNDNKVSLNEVENKLNIVNLDRKISIINVREENKRKSTLDLNLSPISIFKKSNILNLQYKKMTLPAGLITKNSNNTTNKQEALSPISANSPIIPKINLDKSNTLKFTSLERIEEDHSEVPVPVAEKKKMGKNIFKSNLTIKNVKEEFSLKYLNLLKNCKKSKNDHINSQLWSGPQIDFLIKSKCLFEFDKIKNEYDKQMNLIKIFKASTKQNHEITRNSDASINTTINNKADISRVISLKIKRSEEKHKNHKILIKNKIQDVFSNYELKPEF